MFFLFFVGATSKLKGKFLQTLREQSAAGSIFGHVTAFSPKMDVLFVGAEYQNVTQPGQSTPTFRMGAVYAYKYDNKKGRYDLAQMITPPSDEFLRKAAIDAGKDFADKNGWPEIRHMGSILLASEDGRRLITGAPYSNAYRTFKEGDNPDHSENITFTTSTGTTTGNFTRLIEVGAAVVFDYDDNTQKWEYGSVFLPQPKDIIELNGLARVGGISASGNTLCLNYYNRLLAHRNTQGEAFTSTFDPSTKKWSPLTPAPLPPSNKTFLEDNLNYTTYGSCVRFLSETVLMVGARVYSNVSKVIGDRPYPGTQVFIFKNGNWAWDHEILPIDAAHRTDWADYGTNFDFAGSGNSQVLAVELNEKNKESQMVLLQNLNGEFSYQRSSTFTFTDSFRNFNFFQGSADLFISSSFQYADKSQKQADGNGAIRVYQLGNDKKYQNELEILPPKEDRNITLLNFGSSVTWKDKTHVFVGAHHKYFGVGAGLDHPAVYFIELEKDNSKRNGIIIGVVIAAVIVIAIIVAVVIVVKKKKAGSISSV